MWKTGKKVCTSRMTDIFMSAIWGSWLPAYAAISVGTDPCGLALSHYIVLMVTGSSDSWEEEEKDKLEEEETAGDDNDPKLNKYQLIIEQIRREEFGIGVELNEDGQRLMKVQQERLGRSLDRLSRDLYSKDTHFVLELVQNADDNAYPDNILNNENDQCPSVKFRIDSDGVMVQNNENGFREKDIRALCDVGRSTKGKHKFGYIGES